MRENKKHNKIYKVGNVLYTSLPHAKACVTENRRINLASRNSKYPTSRSTTIYESDFNWEEWPKD